MKLTPGQRNYILKNRGKKKPEKIARILGLPLHSVNEILRASPGKGTDRVSGSKVITNSNELSKLAFVCILITIIITPWMLVKSFGDVSLVPKSLLIQGLTLLSLLAYSSAFRRSDRIPFSLHYVTIPGFGFILLALISLTWASDWHRGFIVWMHWAAVFLVFILLQQLLIDKESNPLKTRIHRLLETVFISGVAIAVFGVCQYWFSWDFIFQTAKPAATFGNKNMAAQFVSLILPAGYYVWLTCKEKNWQWIWGMLLIWPLLFVFYTFTRAAWLATATQLLIGATLYFWIRPGRFKPETYSKEHIKVFGVLILVLILFSHISPNGWKWQHKRLKRAFNSAIVKVIDVESKAPVAMPVTTHKPDSDSKSPAKANQFKRGGGSAVNRLIWWGNTVNLIKRYPAFGVGLDNFEIFYPLATLDNRKDFQSNLFVVVDNPHNEYLHLTSELGLLFPVFLGSGFFLLAVAAVRIFGSNRIQMEGKVACVMSLAAIAGLAVNAGFSFPLYRAMPPLLLIIYVSVIIGLDWNSGHKKGYLEHSLFLNRGFYRVVIIILPAVAGIFWLGYLKHQISSNLCYRHQKEAVKGRVDKDIIFWGHRSLHADKWNYRAHHYLGRVYFEEKNYDLALYHLQKMAEAYPYAADNLYYLTRCYEKNALWDKALESLELLIGFFPGDGRLYNLLGRVKRGAGEMDEATAAFRKATEISPRVSSYHYNLATQEHSQGNLEEAYQQIVIAVELSPINADAQKWLGLMLALNRNRPVEGLVHLKKALELDPNITDAAKLHGLIASLETELNKPNAEEPDVVENTEGGFE